MAGIWIAAVITTLFSLGIIGFLIAKISPADDRRFLAIIAAVHLPLCASAIYFVRIPIDSVLQTTLGVTTAAYLLVATLYAPLTEEAAKLWLVLFPWFRKKLDGRTAIHIGMAIGLGFGVGEMWLVAYFLSKNPDIASMPWYLLVGYMNERFFVCLNHAAFTTAALRTIRQAPVRSILFAVGLHWAGNFPLLLSAINFGGIGANNWQTLAGIWVYVYSIGMIVLLAYFYAVSRQVSLRPVVNQLIGKAKCPECGTIYQRPLLAVNLGWLRYERCPGCKKFHMTHRLKESDLDSTREEPV